MGRELRIVGFVVLAAIAFGFLAAHNTKPEKPTPVPFPIADERNYQEPFVLSRFTRRRTNYLLTPLKRWFRWTQSVLSQKQKRCPYLRYCHHRYAQPHPRHHKRPAMIFVSGFICTKFSPIMVRVGDV
jgi:hypothetical protein